MKKQNSGFTLVEILSIITVLGIIVMLVLPNLGGSIDEKKENELNKLINIIQNSAKVYHSFNNDVYKISVNSLIEEEYITTDLINPNTGGKLDGCVYVVLDNDNTYSYKYGSCEGVEVPFSVELNGGTTTQVFNEKYLSSTKIELVDPTNNGKQFKGWKLVKGNSILKGNTLIIGTTETILYAFWDTNPVLTIDLDGGHVSKNQTGTYESGKNITLTIPTKPGYTFAGWQRVSGNSIISGNNITIGTDDTEIKALYELNKYIVTLHPNEGILYNNSIEVTYKNEYGELPVPTREGYTFTGWYTELNGVNRVDSTTLVTAVENHELYAGWLYSDFAYLGSENQFVVPLSGYYQLEVWGAQGGSYSTSCKGGFGGYSTGIVYLEEGETIYINIGGKGLGNGTHTTRAGGYNGGGTATANSDSNSRQSSGGGATHIAKISGLLSTLENNTENILIVAGGGGGGAGNSKVMCTTGGHGGGISGVAGVRYYESSSINGIGYGGTQLSPGQVEGPSTSYIGAFGQGANATYSGGGGGLYGGSVVVSSAGGGSGYIGNSLLTNKAMYCYDCDESTEDSTKTISTTYVSETPIINYAKIGDGFARITYIGE